MAERGKWKNTGSHWESNPWPLTSATSALTTELQQPDNHQHFRIYFTSGTECFSHAPGSHYVCAVRTPLGVDQKHYSIRSKAIQKFNLLIIHKGCSVSEKNIVNRQF